ncbi:hypothetical protein BBJ28_00002487 [Nothophytophthora sp. Chile5]|nr:hypothetical protein BBJ28_00002487 [Nothophytophthora sp. Chile5]
MKPVRRFDRSLLICEASIWTLRSHSIYSLGVIPMEIVKDLGSFVADQASTIEVAVVVKGIKGEVAHLMARRPDDRAAQSVIAVPGNFGPCESLKERHVLLADPFDGAKPFLNADAIADKVRLLLGTARTLVTQRNEDTHYRCNMNQRFTLSQIVVMKRGGCTFARKVLRAQAAGAAAVIIVQTMDVWPYTMTDSTGESKDVAIPAFMMSAKHGKGFVEYLRSKKDEPVVGDVITSWLMHLRCLVVPRRSLDLPSLTVVTRSEDKPLPKWLDSEKVMSEVTGPARATVEETCPKCNNPEMDYYTLQLRSADEGQTVFYECKKCGHKFSVNN